MGVAKSNGVVVDRSGTSLGVGSSSSTGAGGGGRDLSGSSSRAGSLRGGGGGSTQQTYGAIVSAPPGQGPDLEGPALTAAQEQQSRRSLFSILGFSRSSRMDGGSRGGAVVVPPAPMGGTGAASGPSQHTPLLSSSSSATTTRPRRPPSISSTSSSATIDPADPYGYRSLAGPALLPAHAEYVARRKTERRKAKRRVAIRRGVVRVGLGLIVVLAAWIVWVFVLQSGARLGFMSLLALVDG
ncbi:hypothetical protein CF326_g7663 [Tilletia indica]|nr:hypothetical protein CF326_g7663 [Tilletia indica]